MLGIPPLVLLPVLSFTVAAPPRTAAVSTKAKFNWARTKYFYAFGDSYTFVQGTRGHANFSFVGDAFNFSFTPQDLFADEIIPKNTSSDGSNWAEFLTGCFAGKPSECAPHQLWNFAFAGAKIDKALLPLHTNFTIDLTDQVNQWATYASDVIPHPPEETMVAWWIGINDTGDTVSNSTSDSTPFWDLEMQSLFGAAQNVYDHNLRGTYLFINVPPIDRAPAWLGNSRAQFYKQNITEYNSALATHAASFAEDHKDVNVLTFDANAWFGDVLDNASAYGFKNTTGFCQCKDPDYFWFNTIHPTEHVHRLLARAIEAELLRASRTDLTSLD
ncbi:hypothetical protein LXA43DRAFT_1001538 [Ganoderma leucocontextum]|nr:hypothetical protein LXA43DRAFT_1001538 [Ganoderma leucocontextum]